MDKKKMLFAIAAIVLLGAALAAYVYRQYGQPKPETVQTWNILPPLPVSPLVTEAPPMQPPLPLLAQSDGFVSDALAALMENKSLMKLFHTEKIIRNIVITVDNLPQQRVPVKVMPFVPPAGHFLTAGSGSHLTISPRNASRYTSYVKIAEAIDAKQLVALYVRLYPLFQRAYEDFAYPNDNFNEQLNDTLDDLLDTPDIKEPLKLEQPKYFYLYADPDIEARSVGQKIMLRLGSKSVKIVRNKLREIKQELALHSDELKPRKAQ